MKHSLRFKITFLLTGMIFLTIFLTWFINRTFLADYYIYTKINKLDEVYQVIKSVYEKNEEQDIFSEEDTIKLDRLATNDDIDIYLYKNLFPVYPAQDNLGEKEKDKIFKMVQEFLLPGSNEEVANTVTLAETSQYKTLRLYDRRMDTNYIYLMGLYDENNSMILLRTNLESIEDSVAIANKFLAYIGILAVAIGTAAMFIISKRFTKPILDLAGIAKKISDLDFEVKYQVNSRDEIGELGYSINALSGKLETTITELKQANNELLTDIQKKTEVDEMRKEFLSNVSHELKTPISLIQGYAEGLKENINEDEESRDYYCEVIMDEADKMNKMVKKLLSLNELEFGNNQVNFERFDIVPLIHSILNETDILFKQKDVILHFEQNEPYYVWADEYLVEQVVSNYISNALNHVSGPNIIEIKLIPRDELVRIAIFNTGDTIPEEDLDKLWIKFYKVDKARTREYGGSGIGLSIVKAIMNSLKQECGVINRSIGVEFWFELDVKS
jgi:signal transduction histidine kinase